jgi:hypothetical protein
MKRFLLVVAILISFNGLSQDNTDAMTKLKNTKELYEMGLVSKAEYDSISKDLTKIILNTKVESDIKDNPESNIQEGFYSQGVSLTPERFADTTIDILGAALTSGIAGGGIKSYLIGYKSPNVLEFQSDGLPFEMKNRDKKKYNTKEDQFDKDFGQIKFNLRINESEIFDGIANQFLFSAIQSPNDFALVKLKRPSNTNKGGRVVKTGSMSLVSGYRLNIKSNIMIPFEWKEISPRNFEISVRLNRGEYAFVYIGANTYTYSSVYTFSLQ